MPRAPQRKCRQRDRPGPIAQQHAGLVHAEIPRRQRYAGQHVRLDQPARDHLIAHPVRPARRCQRDIAGDLAQHGRRHQQEREPQLVRCHRCGQQLRRRHQHQRHHQPGHRRQHQRIDHDMHRRARRVAMSLFFQPREDHPLKPEARHRHRQFDHGTGHGEHAVVYRAVQPRADIEERGLCREPDDKAESIGADAARDDILGSARRGHHPSLGAEIAAWQVGREGAWTSLRRDPCPSQRWIARPRSVPKPPWCPMPAIPNSCRAAHRWQEPRCTARR